MDHLNVTFVGHVDHGKSTLIGRLLYDTGSLPKEKMEEIRRISREFGHDTEFAYVMDHLKEEREQKMTIDTAQTFFRTTKREYVIIDAPGHKEFLKNMITGASQADAAVLLLDVQEGIMEQTKRHAFILGLLGLKQNVIAVNKMDIVDYNETKFYHVRDQLLAFLDRLNITPSCVIPVSAKTGENVVSLASTMSWYKGPVLTQALDQFAPVVCKERPLRFSVQDVYSWVDEGIAAGRVESGSIKAGDQVIIEPEAKQATVRIIRKFMDTVEKAEAGECVGIAMDNKIALRRGQVVCGPESLPVVTNRFFANVFWMESRPLDRKETLTLRLATQDIPCRVEKIERRIDSSSLEVLESNADHLEETEVGQVIMTTTKPAVVEEFSYLPELGRFVIEKDMHVLAGGIVTGLETGNLKLEKSVREGKCKGTISNFRFP